MRPYRLRKKPIWLSVVREETVPQRLRPAVFKALIGPVEAVPLLLDFAGARFSSTSIAAGIFIASFMMLSRVLAQTL